MPKLTSVTITDPVKLESEFKRIRTLGYAKSDEESVEGIIGYAVPIHDGTGKLAAAIHISVVGKRATKSHERKLLDAARECATQIERHLGRAAPKP
jgi:IclR family pca regulon transcriptional regulator